jgi:hypothetical protein
MAMGTLIRQVAIALLVLLIAIALLLTSLPAPAN